jgi:hypothetical protein
MEFFKEGEGGRKREERKREGGRKRKKERKRRRAYPRRLKRRQPAKHKLTPKPKLRHEIFRYVRIKSM